jgi:GNAT superfamily N-acetyltransferase
MSAGQLSAARAGASSEAAARGTAVPSGLQIRPVSSRRERDVFKRLPWRIYRDDPKWVPPLMMDVDKIVDGKHPFHRHAQVALFLAWRGERAVGRIGAAVNRMHNDFTGDRLGFFGLFEVEDDAEAAAALLGTAETWLKDQGMDRVRGPMSFSTNEELCSPGILVEGFDTPPTIMMAHGRPYYRRLVEHAGYEKAKDLLAYWLADLNPPQRLVDGVARLRKAKGIVLRPMNMRDFAREVERIKEVYHSAWEHNWGFVPMTDAEFDHMAKSLKPVVNPNFVLIAEVGGEPVGFAIGLPDLNHALKHLKNGRLLPFGIFKLLWHQRKIQTARVLTLGIKPGYRRKGLDAWMYLELFRRGAADGYVASECSWILEDNWDMRRGLERMGAVVYKTYRVYEKPLAHAR